jgi:hypothetical protein
MQTKKTRFATSQPSLTHSKPCNRVSLHAQHKIQPEIEEEEVPQTSSLGSLCSHKKLPLEKVKFRT